MHASGKKEYDYRVHDPLSYTIAGAMSATGLGRSKIYQLIAENRLKRIHVGRRTLITAASLRALIDGAA